MRIEETFNHPTTDTEAIERINSLKNEHVLRYFKFCRERLDLIRAWNETMCMYSRCFPKASTAEKWA